MGLKTFDVVIEYADPHLAFRAPRLLHKHQVHAYEH
jgi:hypothetical protein